MWQSELPRIGSAFGGVDAEAPLYVASITYGRRVVFTAESTAASSELKAALDFAYDGIGANVDVNARLSHEEVLNESTIKAFIVGGNADDAVGACCVEDACCKITNQIRSHASVQQSTEGATPE